MIIPTTLDGKPFEGMALVLLAMQIITLTIELRGTEDGGLIGSFFNFLFASIPFVLLGMQKIAEMKTFLLVCSVLSAILFLYYIVMQDTTKAFRVAIGLGTGIAAYFLIDTQYDTAVWVLFASSLFHLMYALFVVGPARSALVKEFRDEFSFFPEPGMSRSDKEKLIKFHLEKVAGMSREEGDRYLKNLIKATQNKREAFLRDYDESRTQEVSTERGLQILRSVRNAPR